MDSISTLLSILFLLFNVLTQYVVQAQQRPRIMEHPADAVAARDEPLTLNCKAAGRPPPEIIWFHNGTPLVPSERRVILPEGSLFFLRVVQNKREQDAGVYWCEARSAAGTAISRNATLQIAMLRDEFRVVPRHTVAVVGGPVTLPCSPPRGIPEPSVLWSKDGKQLDLGGKRLSLVDSGSLLISEVLASDAGVYECSAQSMAGVKTAAPANLKVLAPPTVVRGPHDTEVIEGEGLDLPCELVGDPRPIVSWQRENGKLPDGRSRILLDNTLRIEDTRPEDQGRYVCKGHNEGGNVSITVTLHVYAIPTFIEAPSDVTVKRGNSIKLPCRAQGRPNVRIVWSKLTKFSHEDFDGARGDHLSAKSKIMSFRSKRSLVNHETTAESAADQFANETVRHRQRTPKEEDYILSEFEQIMRDEQRRIKRSARGRSHSRVKRELQPTEASNFFPSPPIIIERSFYDFNDKGDLVLRDVTEEYQGWYACAALNEAGSIVKKVFVRVLSKVDSHGQDDDDDLLNPPESQGSRWGSSQNIIVSSLQAISSSSMEVFWETSDGIPATLLTLYYRVVPQSQVLNFSPLTAFTNQTAMIDSKEATLIDLKPYTEYEVFAAVPHGLGGFVSNIRRRRTLPSAPSAPPTDIKVGIINTTAAFVRWSPPPAHLLNGELTGYKIQIKSNATNKLLGQMSLNATTQSVVINSLSPGGRYIARVAGGTAGGYGPFSAPAAMHMDPQFIIRPPKSDPATAAWSSGWMSGIIIGIVLLVFVGSVIIALVWAKTKKRNMKASFPAPTTGTLIPDKQHSLWLHGNSLVKPTHSLAQVSEYAELTQHNGTAKILNNMHPEPYATVTLQRGGQISDESCVKCSASPSSSEYNAPVREPINLQELLPPPPDHPYSSYRPPNVTNMTIRSNPLTSQISPQVGRRVPPSPPRWGTAHHPPPIPRFPQNWMHQQRLNAGLEMQPAASVYDENDYESGSVLYEQCFRPDESEYFRAGGEPTEEFYRNVNLEFYQPTLDDYYEQDHPSTPPGPAPSDYPNNSNLRLLESPVNPRKLSRSTASAHSSDSESDSGGGGGPPNGHHWAPRRRSRSRSKSNDRKYRNNR